MFWKKRKKKEEKVIKLGGVKEEGKKEEILTSLSLNQLLSVNLGDEEIGTSTKGSLHIPVDKEERTKQSKSINDVRICLDDLTTC